MKHKFRILVLLLFSACSYGQKNNIQSLNKNNIENQNKSKTEFQPIFLDLSPKMTYDEFLNKLKSNSNIINGKFILPINSKNIKFGINKTSNRIVLQYEDVRNISVDKLNIAISQNYISSQEKTINEFIELFKTKYGKPINKFNNNELSDFDYERKYYLAFQDSLKTVLIGYQNFGEIVLSNTELQEKLIADKNKPSIEEVSKQLEKDRSLNSLQRLAYLAEISNTGEAEREYSNRLFNLQPKTYWLYLEINYLYNSEYEKLLNTMSLNQSVLDKRIKIRDSIKVMEVKAIEKNKSKI